MLTNNSAVASLSSGALDGDLCGACGRLVLEVRELACRCPAAAGRALNGTGVHLLYCCDGCNFPRFEPHCSDPSAQVLVELRSRAV